MLDSDLSFRSTMQVMIKHTGRLQMVINTDMRPNWINMASRKSSTTHRQFKAVLALQDPWINRVSRLHLASAAKYTKLKTHRHLQMFRGHGFMLRIQLWQLCRKARLIKCWKRIMNYRCHWEMVRERIFHLVMRWASIATREISRSFIIQLLRENEVMEIK